VPLVVSFTSIHIRSSFALAFSSPCSQPLPFAFAPKRLVTHIYVRRRGAKSAQNPHWLPRSRLRSHLLKVRSYVLCDKCHGTDTLRDKCRGTNAMRYGTNALRDKCLKSIYLKLVKKHGKQLYTDSDDG
jgi:hypothetical protein